MERFGASFLIAGIVTFLLGFFLQGLMPVLTLRKMPITSIEEIAQTIPPEFRQLAVDYPEEFRRDFGPVSTPAEYQNMMNLPHLFGTRRVGPDLIRENGKHSNDWHIAHLYDPRSVAPYSVMPSYPWFFDADRRPTERALALVAYLQWLGSWVPQVPTTIYNVDAMRGGTS
jgi:hypothetical protein